MLYLPQTAIYVEPVQLYFLFSWCVHLIKLQITKRQLYIMQTLCIQRVHCLGCVVLSDSTHVCAVAAHVHLSTWFIVRLAVRMPCSLVPPTQMAASRGITHTVNHSGDTWTTTVWAHTGTVNQTLSKALSQPNKDQNYVLKKEHVGQTPHHAGRLRNKTMAGVNIYSH